MLLIKLGGSLLGLSELKSILIEIKQQQLPILLLPGGGKFADLVRQEQKQYGFSDMAAHKMAIQAMQQYAELLHDISAIDYFNSNNGLVLPAIFPPSKLLAYKWDMPKDWTITSDSLAILLAKELKAHQCLLLKASNVIDESLSLKSLSAQGIIDEFSPIAAEQYHGEIKVLSIQQLAPLKELLCE